MPRFKSKKLFRLSILLCVGMVVAVVCFWGLRGDVWTEADYQLMDRLYRHAVSRGDGPALSPRILYVTVTDASYDAFGSNVLDRTDLARVNGVLADLGVEAVGYDVIFARPSREEADRAFAASLENLGTAYLPAAFALSGRPAPFHWGSGAAYDRYREETLFRPEERGRGRPFYATYALMQADPFAASAMGSGHISAQSDPDGVYRHVLMLVRVGEEGYAPTLSLSMFLDYMRIPFDEILVDWGDRIVVPALEGGFLERDVVIPIDDRGRAFVPFPAPWGDGFPRIEAHALLDYYENPNLRGNLLDYFEGNFVLLGDVSVGAADLGQTPLEADAPLILIHSAMLNGLLNNTFYALWTPGPVLLLVAALGVLLGGAALFRSSWVLYAAGLLILAGLFLFAWYELVHFRLFPLVSTGGSVFAVGFGMIAGIEWGVTRERSFIKGAFAKYVPEKVVHQLLLKPELLRLGGEERVVSVLFSDVAGFTTISERMSPTELVHLLNEYLTEMTRIVLDEGGIVDKFEGDAVMAEFGAPLELPDHADRAVRAGLRMQRRLRELRRAWREKGLPELRCRVGINTGAMVVGNMGSDQVFDYTVMGDAVNLASRLEGANKRYDTYLMISEFTLKALAPDAFRTRVLDVIRVKGKTEPVKVYEVLGEASVPLDRAVEAYAAAYEWAFEAYLDRDFDAARKGFEEALAARPGDPASLDMLGRMEALDPRRLPEGWDGSVALNSK
jgi:adenylate cyclase